MLKMVYACLERFRRPRQESKRLCISDDSLTLIESDREIYHFRWSEVSRIETYKRDLFIVDMICLDFVVDTHEIVYVAHDEMNGFSDLAARLTHYFPSVPPDWWSEVASPAFATKHRVLYERAVNHETDSRR
jgi:hypothetical protein